MPGDTITLTQIQCQNPQYNTMNYNNYENLPQPQKTDYCIQVYNYFLDGFPKSMNFNGDATVEDLTDRILREFKSLRKIDIKKFIDEFNRPVQNKAPLINQFPSNSKLNMEIFFNEGVIITKNNKQIKFFQCNSPFQEEFKDPITSLFEFYQSEKGGKILLGLDKDGIIKGIKIPDQQLFEILFMKQLRKHPLFSEKMIENINISFFRVKGQDKNSYKYQDHKKIMIIKIKGSNQQKREYKTFDPFNYQLDEAAFEKFIKL